MGKTNIATLNVRGLNKPGRYDEVEKWILENDIDILCLQETKIASNQVVSRTRYTWHLSGEYRIDNSEGTLHTGVALP